MSVVSVFYCPLKWYQAIHVRPYESCYPTLYNEQQQLRHNHDIHEDDVRPEVPAPISLPWGTNFPAISYDLSKLRLNIGKGGYNLILSLITSVTYLSWNKSSLVEERYPKVYYHYHHYQP